MDVFVAVVSFAVGVVMCSAYGGVVGNCGACDKFRVV